MELAKYSIRYHKSITGDIKDIDTVTKQRIQKSLVEKLQTNPLLFGEPLRSNLVAYRRLRVGDYRVIYQIKDDYVYILIIAHRKDVYNKTLMRL